MARYFIIYKPFGVLSQFSGEGQTLASLFHFPKTVYPVGRLDKDSEGLLLITDDKQLNHHLLNPRFGHQRTYLAQVEGEPDQEALKKLGNGVTINVEGKMYQTKPAIAKIPESVPELPDRDPPIRYRKNVPDTWISLTLIEGKNRQVRKMTAAVGFPTLRLVRWSMEKITIEGFQVGEVRELEQQEVYRALGLTGFGKTRK
ncbi:pseudouridine synthase [Algoriphagus zhangzhouensis]|uniref:Pseudouridine synthase n=1 Tax=Algoriphagus zhangzhouensis TaxID=1073327 RepID=A0A1M7ZBI2_9BACT|nr:pseudouridine synthase [Algoriphagus zhangzhouensis]TDY46770.1 ribosomal large subunit pseudouridine synthase E [Algoriphagus zhangzhouensis]SHO62271.1 23S rRNA pseudouridine2457 synthase [Algoriphagus zhangzhouensis]